MTNSNGSAFWTCSTCGGMGSTQDTHCPQCGTARSARMTSMPQSSSLLALVTSLLSLVALQRFASRTCPRCGQTNPLFRANCQMCGSSLTSGERMVTPRNRNIAAVLALIGGAIGAQYFYMGRRVLGGVCVVLCWTGYPAVVGLLEVFRLLTMSDAEFNAQCEG